MTVWRWQRALLLVLLIGAFAAAAGLWYLYRGPWLRAAQFPSEAEATIQRFVSLHSPSRAHYETLAAYAIEGFLVYAEPSYAMAKYPGLPAGGARKAEELEGFSRIAPLAAVWLANRPGTELRLSSGGGVDVASVLRSALIAGTDPRHRDYWGDITDRDQRIAEAADIALALWLSRPTVWDRLTSDERAQVVRWLLQVNGKAIADNNWHLFVAQVNVALAALGADHDPAAIDAHLARTLEFLRPDGWFADGPEGPVDYYNAWGFYYHIGWIHRMNPALLADTVREQMPKFTADLVHLLGPNGMPIMGRSVCYRLAVSAPLVFSARFDPTALPPSEARRALDLTWKYFLANGALREGRMTQGYCGDDPAILDNYSGPASCLWSLRSLIVALHLPADAPFWTTPASALPVERADFERPIAGGNWIARGILETGDVTLVNPSPLPADQTRLVRVSLLDRVRSAVRGRASRPQNEAAKYGRAAYGSRKPFCGCAR